MNDEMGEEIVTSAYVEQIDKCKSLVTVLRSFLESLPRVSTVHAIGSHLSIARQLWKTSVSFSFSG